MLRMWYLVTMLLHAGAAATKEDGGGLPQQIHLAFAEEETAMRVSWATQSNVEEEAVVYYGKRGNENASKAIGTTERFRQYVNMSHPLSPCNGCVDEYLHTSVMSGLEAGETYFYTIGSDSTTYEFVAGRGNERVGFTFAVYGDMGTTSPGEDRLPSVRLLEKDVASGSIDGILHVGDLGYNLADNGGHTATDFMNIIQPIASKIPYMVCPGNHEGGTEFAGDFKHFYRRFDMPNKLEFSNNYYSFDVGPVHFIALSSEAYFWQYWIVEQQYEFLKRDLASVNRTKTPWIVTFGHRPFYCSNKDSDDCTKEKSKMRTGLLGGLFALEPLFHKHGVDLAFWAHEHSYERLWPTYDGRVVNSSTDATNPYHNAAGTVHVVTGASGCREGHDHFVHEPRGNWSAVRDSRYGYGRLRIENATHLHWEEIEDETGSIIDEFWLSKE